MFQTCNFITCCVEEMFCSIFRVIAFFSLSPFRVAAKTKWIGTREGKWGKVHLIPFEQCRLVKDAPSSGICQSQLCHQQFQQSAINVDRSSRYYTKDKMLNTDVKHRISNADTKRNGSDCNKIMSVRNTRGIQRLTIRCN